MEVPQLLSMIPKKEWIGKEVLIRVGKLSGYSGKVIKYDTQDLVTLEATLEKLHHDRKANELSILEWDEKKERYLSNTVTVDKDDFSTKPDTTKWNSLNIDYNDDVDMMVHLCSYFEREDEQEEGENLTEHENKGKNHAKENESDFFAKIRPSKVRGMRVDVKDEFGVWNIATICDMNKREKTVKVRYDGWGPEHNNDIPTSSDCLTEVFTYTKEVKCLANLFLKLSKEQSSKSHLLWPCKVKFCMPHPGNQDAVTILNKEANVFVTPYGTRLPSQLTDAMEHNGIWIDAKKIRPLPHNVENTLPEFQSAMNLAKNDNDVAELPDDALEQGALLLEKYRVGGFGVGGTSALESNHMPKKKRRMKKGN